MRLQALWLQETEAELRAFGAVRALTARFRRVAFARVSSVIRLPHLGKAYVLRVPYDDFHIDQSLER